MPFDPDAFLADKPQPAGTSASTFDPDAFLADEPQPAEASSSTFDPDAFLADKPQPMEASASTFDPDAFLADKPQPAAGADIVISPDDTASARQDAVWKKQLELKRLLTDQERAKIYQDDAVARGDVSKAKQLSQDRAELDMAQTNEATARSEVAAVRAPYLVIRGVANGLSMGITQPVYAAIEEAAGLGRVTPESTAEAFGEGAATLLGGVFTGMGLAKGMQSLTGRLGMQGAKQVIATRLLATGAQAVSTNLGAMAADATHGDEINLRRYAGNVAQALGAAVFGGAAEHAVRAGIRNWVTQVATDFVYDLATDVGIRDRLKDQTFVQWLVAEELPQMIMSVAFATKDLRDKNFETQRRAVVKEVLGKFRQRVSGDASRNMPEVVIPARQNAAELGPDVEKEGAAGILNGARRVDRYPITSQEEVDRAVNDLDLRGELSGLASELATIRTELAGGDRIAGRVPKKLETGEIIGWASTGKAYPDGMDANTATAIEKYLAGKPLTPKQQDAVQIAVKHAIERVSDAAGHDIANEAIVPQERLKVGDSIRMQGEEFKVKSEDEDGNITLEDGRKVTMRPGETVVADRESHVGVDGKPVAETARPVEGQDFVAKAEDGTDLPFGDEPAPVRHDMGNGLIVEKTPDNRWEMTAADGRKVTLDPTIKDHHDLLVDLDPEYRAGEVKRIATETADKLPGARLHFVDDETQMGEIRAKYGSAVKDIKAEDGTVKGFAVVGSNDYFLLTRNMTPNQAERVVLHEAAGHIGIRGVLGERVDSVMDGIYASRGQKDSTLKRIAERYGLDLTSVEGRREATEELLANVAERRNTDPGTWRRLVARIKDTFRQMGFEWAQDWNDGDILALIERGRDRVSRPRNAVMSDVQAGVRKAMTYASGRWDDAERQKKVFENPFRRVYEVVRQGKTIYETQAKQDGDWKTVMYSDNLPEASKADYNRPEVSREARAKWLIQFSVSEPWYARAIRAGISPADIFGFNPEVVRLIEAGADTRPTYGDAALEKLNEDQGYKPPQRTEELGMAAEGGIRMSRAPSKNPLKLYTSTHNLSEVRSAKDKWVQEGYTEEGATRLVSRFYKQESYQQLRGENPILVTVPSTSGKNIIPMILADRLAKDFSGTRFNEELATPGAAKESKRKTGFWAKLEDPVVYVPRDAAIEHLKQRADGKPVWIVEDVHNTGESWMQFKRMLSESGISVRGVLTLGASDFRITSNRDIERLSGKLSATLKLPVDDITSVVQHEFHEASKQWFNYAERIASTGDKQAAQLWDALRSRYSAGGEEGAPGASTVRNVPEIIPGGRGQDVQGETVTPPEIRRSAKDINVEAEAAKRKRLTEKANSIMYGRPDLAQMGESKTVRALGAEVDQVRNERGEPSVQRFREWKDGTDARIQKDMTGEWLNFLTGKLHYEGDDAGENTMVARKLLETKGLEAFSSGSDEDIAKVAAAMWGYRNARSNLARALAAGRDFQETPAERNRRFIAEALYYPGAKVDRKLQGMDLGAMQAELAKRAGKMQELRKKLLDMGIDIGKLDEKMLNDNAAMSEIVRQIQISNAGWGDMAYEYWRNAILSSPVTHAANTMGNTASLAWNYTAQKGTEALINAITGNKQGVTFSELPGMWKTMRGAQTMAARNAMTAFSTEQAIVEGIRLEEKGVAIGGTAGRVVRTPQRTLLAADEYAKTVIMQAELYSMAYRDAYAKGWRGNDLERQITEILKNPKSDMLNKAIDEARRLTFTAEPGAATQWLLNSRKIPGIGWVSKFAIPFVSTPVNITKAGLRKSPLGALNMAMRASQGDYSGNRNMLVRDAAEQVLAVAGTLALWSLVADEDDSGLPRITGSRPAGNKNPGKVQAQQRLAPAQSIRIGGTWYSYSRIEPLATAMTWQVDALDAIKNRNGEDGFDRLSRVFAGMRSLVRDKTYLATIGDVIRAIEDDSKGIAVASNFLASWTPNIIRTSVRAFDPYTRDQRLRQRDDRSMAVDFAANVGQATMPAPGLQDAPRMDYWGRAVEKGAQWPYATDVLWRMFSPIQVQTAKTQENFDRLLFNYNRKAAQKGWELYWPSMPDNTFEGRGPRGVEKTARMNPDEYSIYLDRRGKIFLKKAADRRWSFDDPKLEDIQALQGMMRDAGASALKEIRKTHGQPPSWKTYQDAKERQEAQAILGQKDREMAFQIFGR
jgi:hypothetical protein